jgi:RNA recognition motif-containing protein
LGEADLRDVFYAFGEVRTVKLLPAKKCAFVDFTSREAAELAATKLHRNLEVTLSTPHPLFLSLAFALSRFIGFKRFLSPSLSFSFFFFGVTLF